jgi:hypothetical protein
MTEDPTQIEETNQTTKQPNSYAKNKMAAKQNNLKYKCDICDFSSAKTDLALQKHINTVHLQRRDFKCDHCDKAYGTKTKLTQHVNAVHKKITRFGCELCDYTSYTRHQLVLHLSVHEKTKEFKCDHCDKEFSQKGSLMEHIKRLHKKMALQKMTQYSCDLCVFTSCSKQVMSKHSDDFHFWNCHLCDEAFSVKSSLVCHINTVHSKMSSYNCESSDQRSDVLTHSKTVHIAQPSVLSLDLASTNPTFQCDMCDMTFTGKAELCAHKDILHKCSFTFVNVTADNQHDLNKDPIDEDILHTKIEVKIEPV